MSTEFGLVILNARGSMSERKGSEGAGGRAPSLMMRRPRLPVSHRTRPSASTTVLSFSTSFLFAGNYDLKLPGRTRCRIDFHGNWSIYCCI
jgi:hypothetical protein